MDRERQRQELRRRDYIRDDNARARRTALIESQRESRALARMALERGDAAWAAAHRGLDLPSASPVRPAAPVVPTPQAPVLRLDDAFLGPMLEWTRIEDANEYLLEGAFDPGFLFRREAYRGTLTWYQLPRPRGPAWPVSPLDDPFVGVPPIGARRRRWPLAEPAADPIPSRFYRVRADAGPWSNVVERP